MKKKKRYSVKQYAQKIGKSVQWVHRLIERGTVKAEKIGNSYIIEM